MPMYNFLEFSSNYSDKTGSLWFHSKDEATNFMYKAKLVKETVTRSTLSNNNGILKKPTTAAPLKYLIIFGDHRKCR